MRRDDRSIAPTGRLKERDAELQFVLYWTVTRPAARDYTLRLYLLDEGGQVRERAAFQQPTLVWHPTSQWRPGETVRVLANTITWSTESLDRFGVGLAASVGEEDGAILRLGEFRRQFGATWPTD